jgi:uncharacterized protein YecE (DUF72 family)
MAGALIGLSGWSYDSWRDDFYRDVPKKDWLAHYATVFSAVEINATFYGQQRPSTLEKWRASVPDGFSFVVKANRFLTHTRRLAVERDSITKARRQCQPLGEQAAAVLYQLPASFRKDLVRLQRFADLLQRHFRGPQHCFELRHPSWFDAETERCLDDNGLVNVISDAADWPRFDAVTGPASYLRLHGHSRTYRSRYSRGLLTGFAERARGWLAAGRGVYAFFDNTDEGHAPSDARRFRELLEGGG